MRDSSPVVVGGGSSSSVIGMQPAYMLMQVGGDGAALSETQRGEEEGQMQELDLSRRNLRSGSSSGGGIALTRVMREFRCWGKSNRLDAFCCCVTSSALVSLQVGSSCGAEHIS